LPLKRSFINYKISINQQKSAKLYIIQIKIMNIIIHDKTRATQSVVYPLAYKLDPVALTFDLENQ
jgi:hypothetical protein